MGQTRPDHFSVRALETGWNRQARYAFVSQSQARVLRCNGYIISLASILTWFALCC
jgi:hypothetical protein